MIKVKNSFEIISVHISSCLLNTVVNILIFFNGIKCSDLREWLGFWGDDVEILIEFPEPRAVRKVVNLSRV